MATKTDNFVKIVSGSGYQMNGRVTVSQHRRPVSKDTLNGPQGTATSGARVNLPSGTFGYLY